MKINRIFAISAISLSLVTGIALAIAPAISAAQIIVAESQMPTAVPTPVPAFTATPSATGALNIKADPQSRVFIKTKGQDTKSVTTNKAGVVQLKNLTPGVSYLLTTKIGNTTQRITAVPEGPVVAANSLRVLTTEIPGQLEITWRHASTPAQGAVSFTVTAQPVNSPTEAIEVKTANTEMVLIDLDLDSRFEFSVTATNTISSATPTMALMTKSLNDLNGEAVVTTPVKQEVATEVPAGPASVTPSGPSTRTIYICPDSFTEVGALCEKTLPYTFTNANYTFHSEARTENCSGPDCPGSVYMDMGYIESPTWGQVHCPNGGTNYGQTCMAWSTSSRQVTEQVKDTAPSGFTDTGTNWTKKDTTPAGYTDNGTNWVSTTAKVAREVPA